MAAHPIVKIIMKVAGAARAEVRLTAETQNGMREEAEDLPQWTGKKYAE